MALQIKDAELGQHYPFGYARGAKPGYQCKVTLQVGEKSYENFSLKLSDEATKSVLALIVAEAMKQITLDPDAIDVVGAPGEPASEEAPGECAAPIAEAA